MEAEGIVDILLETGVEPEASEFFRSYLLQDPSFIFKGGEHSMGPSRSECGDHEISQGQRIYSPRKNCFIDTMLWIHPSGYWHLGVIGHWGDGFSRVHCDSDERYEPGVYARDDREKMTLIAAIQAFLPKVEEALNGKLASYPGDSINRIVRNMYFEQFQHLFGHWKP